MKGILLDNGMFDDGSFECHNFWFNTDEGTEQIDAAFITKLDFKEQIVERMLGGHKHLVTNDLVYGGVRVLEIIWD